MTGDRVHGGSVRDRPSSTLLRIAGPSLGPDGQGRAREGLIHTVRPRAHRRPLSSRRRRRRWPPRRRGDGAAAGAGRPRCARRRPWPVGARCAVDPRLDAQRRRPAAAMGSARRRHRRRDATGAADHVDGRRRGHDDLDRPSYGVDALYAPRRAVLDPILVDAAVRAGAELHRGTTVDAVTRDDTGRVTGVAGRDEHGRHVVHRARWVVGADGVRSTIARAVGCALRAARHAPRPRSCTATGRTWPPTISSGSTAAPRAPACCRRADGQACVFAAAPPARVGGGVAALRELVALASPALARRLAAGSGPADVRGGGGRPGFLRRPCGSRLGARRRRRRVDGPGRRPRPDRGAARRRAAGGGAGRPPHRASAPRPTPSPGSTPRATASPGPCSTSSTPSPASTGRTTRSPACSCGCARR